MPLSAILLLLLAVVGICSVPQRRYVDPWYDMVASSAIRNSRLAPRVYASTSELNRPYNPLSEAPVPRHSTPENDFLRDGYPTEVIRAEVTRGNWYDRDSGKNKIPGEERQVVQVVQVSLPEAAAKAQEAPLSSEEIAMLIDASFHREPQHGSGPHRHEGNNRRKVEPSHAATPSHNRRTNPVGNPGSGTNSDPELRILSAGRRRSPSQGVAEGNTLSRPHHQQSVPHTTARPSNRTRTDTRRPQSGDIVFPDNNHTFKFIPSEPSDRDSSTYSENETSYPADYIKRVMGKGGEAWNDILGRDEIIEPNVNPRIDLSVESPLCRSTETVVFPKKAKNKDDKWLFIVNQDEFEQGVRVEKCIQEDEPCDPGTFPTGYIAQCKQKYIYRKMLCLNEEGKPKTDEFRLPSCCSCYIRQTTSARMDLLFPQKATPAVTRKRTKTRN